MDRSLDMYIYDLYIYIDNISLSIYRSIFLYLFWLADIFASVECPDNKNLYFADTILIKFLNLLLGARQHHTTSGSIFLFWPLTDGKFANLPSQDPYQAKKTLSPLYSMSVLLFGFLWNQICRVNYKECFHPTYLFIIMIIIIKFTIVYAL